MRPSTWTNLITYILDSLLMMVGLRVALKSFYLQRESSTHLRVLCSDSKFLDYYIASYSMSSQQLFKRLQQSIFISSPIGSSGSLCLDPSECIYSELYTSNAFIAEHNKICTNCNRQDSGSQTENIVIAIMLWSDSTHLMSFRNASLWPIYLYVGSLSKYI